MGRPKAPPVSPPSLSPQPFPTVVLVGFSSGGLDEQILRGFNKYRRTTRPWMILDSWHDRRWLEPILQSESVSGFLANVTDEGLVKRLQETGRPVVDVACFYAETGFQRVGVDNAAVAQLAADYFVGCGYRTFAFLSMIDLPFEVQRWQGFSAALRKQGHRCVWVQRVTGRWTDDQGQEQYLEVAEAQNSRWVRRLPQPLAIFAATERAGAWLSHNCRIMGVGVPEQVAILVAGNTESICESAYTPLSAIEFPGEKVGFEAARRLDLLMSGRRCPPKPCFYAPLGVVARQSTAATAIQDPLIAQAVVFIRGHATERIGAAEVVEHVGIDRRSFDRRFRKALGRSALEELYRVRLEAAKQRLLATDQKLQQVASESGFGDADNMAVHFRRMTGMTPNQFREQFRLR